MVVPSIWQLKNAQLKTFRREFSSHGWYFWYKYNMVHTTITYLVFDLISIPSDWDKSLFFLDSPNIFMTFSIIYHITGFTIWNLWFGVSTSIFGVVQKLLESPLLMVNPCNSQDSGITHRLRLVSFYHI